MEITLTMIVSVIGVLMTVWGGLFGYVINRLSKLEDRQDKIDNCQSGIQASLAQIQTDLQWIKVELQKKS